MDKSFKVLEQCVLEMMDKSLHIEEREFAMERALSTISNMVNTYIGGDTMLYNHRVWFAGQDSPIGFNTGEVLHGLLEVYGRDSIIYIEDMKLKSHIDKVISALEAGVLHGFTFIEGSYYIEGGQWMKGRQPITELDMRRRLQSHYKDMPDMVEEDSAYIEERGTIIQSS